MSLTIRAPNTVSSGTAILFPSDALVFILIAHIFALRWLAYGIASAVRLYMRLTLRLHGAQSLGGSAVAE
jgi:hypothetical protein